jgi:hypothetical protein
MKSLDVETSMMEVGVAATMGNSEAERPHPTSSIVVVDGTDEQPDGVRSTEPETLFA